MDLTDLTNAIKEWITPGSTAMHTAPGQTYGPSVSIASRTPINFRQLNGESGIFQNRYTSPLGQLLPGNRGEIYIDPTSQDFQDTYKGNVQPVIQHESTHALLEPDLSDEDYTNQAKANPAYTKVASHIANSRDGFMPAEVPAYAAETGAAQRYGIPQSLLDVYRQGMQQTNPATANIYSKILGK